MGVVLSFIYNTYIDIPYLMVENIRFLKYRISLLKKNCIIKKNNYLCPLFIWIFPLGVIAPQNTISQEYKHNT